MVDAGFSNKTLSFVFIENADRFGIAQLHQIRGRVGRGSLQGHCYLSVIGNIKESTLERLQALVKSENGFELSMKDIELRGSGDLTGLEQSGSDVNLIEWLKEIEVMDEYLKGNLL
jgi:ATP-dependent DNA helicase RecG